MGRKPVSTPDLRPINHSILTANLTSSAGPSVSDIERIAALVDPAIRNLQITQCYHELALILAERTGAVGANWCTFATWASKQAGQTIRKEDLGRTLELILGSEEKSVQTANSLATSVRRQGVRRRLEEIVDLIWQVNDSRSAFDRSSEAVARGNLKVFSEIGREFARFHAECLPDVHYDPAHITAFCEQLSPGEPPGGQRFLRQAFQRYYQALFETDPKARIELLLLGNLEIGFHEQTRLQPEINEALQAPLLSVAIFARNFLHALYPGHKWLLLRAAGRLTGINKLLAAYLAMAQREAQFMITETMMMIEMPQFNRIRLGDDLADRFPPILQQVTNSDLLALLAQIDPTPNSTVQSGALLWGDLPDRLHFIADLFRCYQVDPRIFEPPFTNEQVAELKSGRLPPGRL
jgi:hypothetical protein